MVASHTIQRANAPLSDAVGLDIIVAGRLIKALSSEQAVEMTPSSHAAVSCFSSCKE